MRVLIIGSGAREHALALALSADSHITSLHIAPGNAGTSRLCTHYDVDMASGTAVAALAQKIQADLVVIGPEVPLILGVADAVRNAGIACFGPSSAAAHIEGSKAFAKDVMAAAGVRTAHSEVIDNPAKVDDVLDRFGPTWVVKDDGLAAGKGVVVTPDRNTARAHAAGLLEEGHRVLVESFLTGPEVSLFCLVDGETVVPLLPAQDYKRVGDKNLGPNTGGMGAYAPVPWLSDVMVTRIVNEIVKPVAKELVRRKSPFSGLLYAGLVIEEDPEKGATPTVVEFNCRFGDPETQAILPLLKTPLGDVLYATATGQLAQLPPLEWKGESAVVIVLAAENYPFKPRVGDVISGTEKAGVLHAGTLLREDGAIVSSGGRVLNVVGTGIDIKDARRDAYNRLALIRLPGSHFRSDIGDFSEVLS